MTIHPDIQAQLERHTMTFPLEAENKVKEVMKKDDDALQVTLMSGESFTIPAEEAELQSWIVFTTVMCSSRRCLGSCQK